MCSFPFIKKRHCSISGLICFCLHLIVVDTFVSVSNWFCAFVFVFVCISAVRCCIAFTPVLSYIYFFSLLQLFTIWFGRLFLRNSTNASIKMKHCATSPTHKLKTFLRCCFFFHSVFRSMLFEPKTRNTWENLNYSDIFPLCSNNSFYISFMYTAKYLLFLLS